ncbi:2295_t:CDS:2, partial [Funneliformis geosporum]
LQAANGWPDNRRVVIAAGMLRDEAADWYNLINGDIDRWDGHANTRFRERFLARFSSQEKFKKLASRVDAGGIPEAFKVRMFLNGLNKELATL